LIRMAAQKGYRIFFLGGSPEATVQAVARLQTQYPDLIIAGHYSPPFADLLQMDQAGIKQRIASAHPDLLFVSFGCPKQEKWIAMHYRSLGVPVSIGVGGTIDFLAGRLVRAPLWMQRTGTEWLFRLAQEPRRLFKRYAKDCTFFAAHLFAQWCRMRWRPRGAPPASSLGQVNRVGAFHELRCPEWLDAQAVARHALLWERELAQPAHVMIHLAGVRFIDSTGVGWLIRLRKRAGLHAHHVILVQPSPAVQRALQSMRLWPFFLAAGDIPEAMATLEKLAEASPVVPTSGLASLTPSLAWRGEITAANAEVVWTATDAFLTGCATSAARLTIDLHAVSFIDSTGLGLMVRAKKQAARTGATLLFTGLQPNVQNVARLSRLEPYLMSEQPY
jgi:N-acetylglucosaminyldiphosphoundecaprenol N-acetyl-beta-D-mannosaminyltransferase